MLAQNCEKHYEKKLHKISYVRLSKKNFPIASSLPWDPKEIGDFTISRMG